ncbi:O-antigen ligase family protein [Candidatus Sumerlaeota bacterium]|nr:O-antigen ligase family protein [Candidatus Sumerlaeota bacterium]
MITRTAAGILSALMLLVLARFLAQPDTLRLFTIPAVLLFTVFGWIRPSMGLYPLIFLLPLTPLVPHVRGVANFSLVEVMWWALCMGRAARRAIDPRPLRLPPPPSWSTLVLLTVVVCGSAAVRLLRNAQWADPIVWRVLWDDLGHFFRWSQESRLMPLRAAVVWLEGVAFLDLVRRNAPRDSFQRRIRILLILSLTFVVLISLHQFALAMTLGDGAPETLAAWQVEPDWLPDAITDRWTIRAVHGPWPDVNSFASYLLMCFPLLLSAFVLSRNVFGRALLMLLGAGTALVLVLTFSRIALLWLPITLLIWLLLSRARLRRLWEWVERRGRLVVISALVAAMALLGLLLGSDRGAQAVEHALQTAPAERLNVALKGRVNIWRKALAMTHEAPILGVGWGSFHERAAHYHHREADTTSWGESVWNPVHENAHNQFLQILAESGVVGLGLTLLLMLQWLGIALRSAVWGKGGDRWTARALMASVIALAGTLLTGHALLLIEMHFLFWVLVGIAFIRPRGPNLPRPPQVPPPWSGRAQVALIALIAIFAVRAWNARGAPDLHPWSVGLHPVETEALSGHTFQWTTGHAALMLRNIQGDCGFHLSNARPDLAPVTVEVWINGELRDRVTPPDNHWWPYRFDLPDVSPNATYRLDLRPLQIYPDGDRELGIRLRAVSY